jgi:hypothetical protein
VEPHFEFLAGKNVQRGPLIKIQKVPQMVERVSPRRKSRLARGQRDVALGVNHGELVGRKVILQRQINLSHIK